MYLFIILLFLTENPIDNISQRKLNIVYDDSPQSKMLYAELTRDWLSKGVNEASLHMNNIQADIRLKINLIDRYGKDIKYRNISVGYPCYFWGDYGTPEKYPDLTFNETSYPLRTTQSIISEFTVDASEWKSACKQADELADWDHYLELRNFARSNFPQELDKLFECYDPEIDCWIPWSETYKILKEKFSEYDSAPSFKPAVYPECPIIKKPWEN